MTSTLPTPLPARVLLLGSGELGKEVTISLKRYGATVIACDSYAGAPAMQVADSFRVFDMADPRALREVLAEVDVDLIVPEVEAIATAELAAAEERGVRVVPNAYAVTATMDRERIRNLAACLPGVRTCAFRFARSEDELAHALDEVGYPAFVKPTMSSSGHGQSCVTSRDQACAAWRAARDGARADTGVVIVEEGIDFDYEITLLTLRSWDAQASRVLTSFCAPIGHRQEGGDYVESWQPMAMSSRALRVAHSMAREVTDALAREGTGPCLGIFGVEFFVRGDDVWFSELSPRPHDTGMVTMATQGQSEFELHARAILGLPTSTEQRAPGASAVIRAPRAIERPVYDGVGRALATADVVRIFGKPVSRAHRRLGVVVATAASPKEARVIARRAAQEISVEDAPA